MEKAIIALDLAIRLLGMVTHAHKTGNDIPDTQLKYVIKTAKAAHEKWINRERN